MMRTLIAFLSCILLASPAYSQFLSVRIQVLDRGQADGIVIRTPNQKWIVIDAGTNGGQTISISIGGMSKLKIN